MQVPLLRNRKKVAALMLFLILATLLPAATLAQQPTPPADSKPAIYEGRPLTQSDLEAATAQPAEEPVVEPPAATEPLAPASPDLTLDAISPSVQGAVQINVSVPSAIRAGQNITFTYIYTNTGAAAVSGIRIKAIWPYNVGDSNNVIYCGGGNCAANTLVGPTVTSEPLQQNPTFRFYNLSAALAAGASGRFAVYMRSNAGFYPKTGQSITRPSSSAELYVSPNVVMSDDTASSLVVGPVFYMTKSAAPTTPIYPVIDTGIFTVTVGNATGPGDVVNPGPQQTYRADARPANNIVLTDFFPLDGIFVSATPSAGTVTTTTNRLTWSFPTLAIGETRQVVMRFRKGNTAQQCDVLSNSNYNVTSKEIPVPFSISGPQSAQITVLRPLKVSSIVFIPSSTIFGNQLSANIEIENYWNQDLTGVVFHYDIQSNAAYINNTADPSTGFTVSGKRLSWTFNMPKAINKTTPTKKIFKFDLLAGYTSQANPGANAQIIAPAGVPNACIQTLQHTASIRERLSFVKITDADPSTQIGGNLFVAQRGQPFSYIIRIRNEGADTANNVKVTDFIPSGLGANFVYVPGSSTLNGTPRAPDTIQNGNGGKLEWTTLTVPADSIIELKYSLTVQGDDYITYCNTASVTTLSNESVLNGGNVVCVKINPNLEISKEILDEPSDPQPGDTIRFRLTLTNHENTPYTLGLYDLFGSYLNVRHVSGYGTPAADGDGRLKWPLQTLAPGDQISAVIDADIPNVCQTARYENEALFWYMSSQSTPVIIRRIPEMRVGVQVICGKINYSKNIYNPLAAGNTTSLGDRVGYQLTTSNADDITYNNIHVDDYLPPGFTFHSMDTSSSISDAPTQETVTVVNPQTQQNETRIKLHWTIPSLSSGGTNNIKYLARAGVVVGQADNWVRVPDVGLCTSDCIVDGGGNIYSRYSVTVAPLITAEPSLTPNTCAQPGQQRTYKASIVNTNNHAYASTGVTITLPLGLRFGGTLGDTPAPSSISTDATGMTKVSWSGLNIAAGAPFSQRDLQMNLVIGQVWGELHTAVQTTSPDGLIPLKDGATDVTVTVCPPTQTQGALAKEVSDTAVQVGDEIIYQISLANPTASPISTTITDQLPANMTYLEMVEGADPSSTSPLTWAVTVPAAAGGKPGSVVITFKVRVNSGEIGQSYPNSAQSSVPVDTTYATVGVSMPRVVYLSLIAR
jgi:uncharacterized repeat protein (TIGR01451 family)